MAYSADTPVISGGDLPVPEHIPQYKTRIIESNKAGYVKITQNDTYHHYALITIDDLDMEFIIKTIDFPPAFKNDLGELNGSHFYSYNDNCYYFCAGKPDVKVKCIYRYQKKPLKRKVKVDKCGYAVVEETIKWKHVNLYGVLGYNIDLTQLLIFTTGLRPIYPDDVPMKSVPKRTMIGQIVFDIAQKILGDDAANLTNREQWEERRVKLPRTAISSTPTCLLVGDRYAYNPVNIYQGNSFYCPHNSTYYFYVGKPDSIPATATILYYDQ
ncbi:MAG: hypothetical protein VKL42_08980 [Snowella sp.]|nr:hypothetical protein [Snowella sp.]